LTEHIPTLDDLTVKEAGYFATNAVRSVSDQQTTELD